MSNLKVKDIREIYRKVKNGVPIEEVCKEYGVQRLFVFDIVDGHAYADITGADGSNGRCY